MKYYLGKLMYYGEEEPGALCDQWGATVLIKSDDDLTEVRQSELENYYEIQEELIKNNCEELHLEEIDKDEYDEYVEDVKIGKIVSLYINKSML